MSSDSIHKHHGPVAEIIGFACRWLVLTASAGLIALAGWACLRGTIGVSQDIHCQFAIPDVLCKAHLPENRYCSQPGLVIGPTPTMHMPAVLGKRQAGLARFGRVNSGHGFGFYWPACEAGLDKATFVGAPYSALAFSRYRASVLGVPDGKRVFLVDARLMPDAPDAAWTRTLATMGQRGLVAMFAVGELDEYEAAFERRARDDDAKDLPLLYRLKPAPYVLRRAASDIRHRRRDIDVLTDDAKLADEAARKGFSVHLIAPNQAETPHHHRVKRHRSLAEFGESLQNPTP